MAKDKVKEASEAEAPGEGEEGAASARKKLPLKLLIIGGVAAVLVLGGGGTAAFMFLGAKPDPAGQGEAKAEKDGSTYKISGTATGVDMANPMQPVNKPFEIEVTCP